MNKKLRPVTIRESVKVEDLNLPEIIYKYRDWDNKYHRTILTDSEVYFASPRDFEDPNDCKNLLDYSLLTDEEIYNRYYSHSKKRNPNGSEQEHQTFANSWVERGLMRDKKHIQATMEEYQNKFFDCFGVLSLTANYRSSKMWKKYANNRKGFCVGINSNCFVKDNPDFGGGAVEYFDKLPRIHPFEERLPSYAMQIYSKEVKWEFEQEFRLHRRWENPAKRSQRVIKIPNKCVRKVVFGADINGSVKKEIKKIAKKNFSNVSFIQMFRHGTKK